MNANNAPLGPPPRQADYRRGVQKLRRVYRTFFLLLFIYFLGSALGDLLHLQNLEPAQSQAWMTSQSYFVIKLLATGSIPVIFVWIERHLGRELALARNGVATVAHVTQAIERKVRRRSSHWLAFSFCVEGGATLSGRVQVSRLMWQKHREPGSTLEVIYDPANPQRHQLRASFEFVEF